MSRQTSSGKSCSTRRRFTLSPLPPCRGFWHVAEANPEGHPETLLFLSTVMQSAPERGDDLRDLHGLSPALEAHQHDWLAPANRLSPDDLLILARLRDWTALTFPAIAKACVAAASGRGTHSRTGTCCTAPPCLKGGCPQPVARRTRG